MILIIFAVLFLVALFLIKNKVTFKNSENVNNQQGLNTGTETLESLINKDTDGDGLPDWEEKLWGTDPTKKETTAGTPDSVAISKIRISEGGNVEKTNTDSQEAETLSKTDQFSRELFATIAAASQSGNMDQATIDKLGEELAKKIQNPVVRKVYSMSDIKIINEDSIQALKNYNTTLNDIYIKYPIGDYTILDVLQKFMADPNNLNISVLTELDPIIKQMNSVIPAMVKTSVPQSISTFHLSVINSLERLSENLSDIKLFGTDVIVALSGISKYEENSTKLEADINALLGAMAVSVQRLQQQP